MRRRFVRAGIKEYLPDFEKFRELFLFFKRNTFFDIDQSEPHWSDLATSLQIWGCNVAKMKCECSKGIISLLVWYLISLAMCILVCFCDKDRANLIY